MMSQDIEFEDFKGLKINRAEIYKRVIVSQKNVQDRRYLENLESKLNDINYAIQEEKKQKERARQIGGGIGLTAGAYLGRVGGVGTSMGLAATGLGVGGNVGKMIEEAWDVMKGNKTDIELEREAYKLKKEITKVQYDENDN